MLIVSIAISLAECVFADNKPEETVPVQISPELKAFQERLKAGQKQTVVVYGTSLTEGGRWTVSLKNWFEEKYPGQVTFVNSGMSGQNSDAGIKHIQSRVIDKKPDLVFIEFAINDAHVKFNLTPEHALDNLNKMVKAIRENNPQTAIVLQVMNPVWDNPKNTNNSATNRPNYEAFCANYRNYARDNKLPLLDHWVNWVKLRDKDPEKFKLYVTDGTHPSAHASVTVTWPLIQSMLEADSSSTN